MGKKFYQPSEYYNNPDPIVPDMFADPRSYALRSFFLKPFGVPARVIEAVSLYNSIVKVL